MSDIVALEQYVLGKDKVVEDKSKVAGAEGAYYATNRAAGSTVTYGS